MKTSSLVLIILTMSCTCSVDVKTSSEQRSLITASGVRPSIIVDNHGSLEQLAAHRLDGSSLVITDSGRQMLTLLVACALGNEVIFTAELDGVDIEFFGEAGLAKEWATKRLSNSGKGWVSACVLAHLSAAGLPVPISMRGQHPALRPSRDERVIWTIEEGAFFGNIFTAADKPIKWFACRGKGEFPDSLDRKCAKQDPAHPDLTLCGLTFTGSCPRYDPTESITVFVSE